MDLKTFDFPKPGAPDIMFPTYDTIDELLKEAHARGFGGDGPYDKLFSKLFFSGGKIQWKPDVDPELKAKAWPYCRALMRSWSPKHEHKQAVCAMLMSELLLPDLAPSEQATS